MNATHHGYADDQKKIIARLNRIEGQVRGIRQMTENGEYCIDILTQISAVNSALKSVALLLVDDHLNHCVKEAIEEEGKFRSENRRGKRGHSTPRKIVDRKTCQSPIQQAKTHHRRQIGDCMIRPEKFQPP